MRRTGKAIGTLAAATSLSLLGSGVALADVVSNDIDAAAETIGLTAGGPNGTTQLSITPTNGDGKNGCNLTGSTSLTLALSSSNTGAATVAPSSVTFTSCSDVKTLTVTPVAAGSTSISAAQTANTTGGTFNLAPAAFTVTVTAAAAPAPADPCDTATTPAAPTITGTPDTPDGDNLWFRSAPSVAATSGDATITYATQAAGPFTGTAPTLSEGQTTVHATATAPACSSRTATTSRLFKVDSQAPAVSDDQASTAWTNAASVTSQPFSASDDTSGLADSSSSSFTLSATGQSTKVDGVVVPTQVRRDVFDHAGNSAPAVFTALIDRTAPAVSAAQAAGTWTNAASVTSGAFTASDALSELADAADGSFTLTATAPSTKVDGVVVPTQVRRDVVDNAGNSSPAIFTALIDRTAPTVTCPAAEPTFTLNQLDATVTAALSDALSGSAATTGARAAVGALGRHSVTVTGSDNAGNTGSATCSYSVKAVFTGLNAATDGTGMAKAKAGSAIPLKWRITDASGAGVAGLTATDLTATSSGVSCTATVTDTAEALAAGSSSLQDLGDGYYQYNWKTASAWGGTCRVLNLSIAGAGTSGAFQFTK